MRNLASATAVSMAIASGGAHALGLGGIQLNSSLNQPLSADIEVVSDSLEEAQGLVAKLASEEAFIRAGIDRPFSLTELDFELRESNGRIVIHVSSDEPISEPFLNFLIEVGWARGSLVREYTVLLDPPVFLAELGSGEPLIATQSGGEDDPSLPRRIERGNEIELSEDELKAELEAVNAVIATEEVPDGYGAQIVELEDLRDQLIESPEPGAVDLDAEGRIAAESLGQDAVPQRADQPSVDEDRESALAELLKALSSPAPDNTATQPDGDAIALATAAVAEELDARGSTGEQDVDQVLDEPAASDATVTSTQQTEIPADSGVLEDIDSVVAELDRLFAESASDNQALQESRERAAESSADAASSLQTSAEAQQPPDELGPVRNGQTLWSFARANRVSGATIEQTMIAMLRENPAAFEGDNVNALLSGSILRIPDADSVLQLDGADARELVSAQNSAWQALRSVNSDTAVTARIADTGAEGGELTAEAEGQESTESAEAVATDIAAAGGNPAAGAPGESGQSSSDTDVGVGAESTSGSLSIVAGETSDGATGAGEIDSESTARIASLEEQLAVAREEVESERQNAAELQSRVADLEQAVEQMNNLLELGNAELARLQSLGEELTSSEDAANSQIERLQGELDTANERLQTLIADGDVRQAEAEARIIGLQAELTAARASAEAEVARLSGEAEAARKAAELEAQAAAEAAAAVQAAENARLAAEARVAAEAERAAAAEAEAEAERAAAAEAQRLAEQEAVAAQAEQDRLAAEQAETERLATEREAAEREAAKPWYAPLLNPDNAAWVGAGFAGLLFLWFLLARRARKEEEEFPDSPESDKNAADEPGSEFVDETRYDSEQIAQELNVDETTDATFAASATAISDAADTASSYDHEVDATVVVADPPLPQTEEEYGDVLAEADVYLSYGLADRAEDLLNDVIENGADNEALHGKRLEALFSKQDATAFADRAQIYNDKFGDNTTNWPKIASWGAALAPSSALFAGAAPAGALEEEFEATEVVEVVEVVDGGGLASDSGLGSQLDSELSEASLSLGDGLRSELDQVDDTASAEGASLEDIAAGGALDGTAVVSGSDQDIDNTSELTLAADDLSIGDLPILDDAEIPDLSELDKTGGLADGSATGEFEQSLDATNADGTELGDQTLDMEQLEAELLETDLSADVGGLSDELDFDAAGLSIVENDDPADMTATGDEVDTMLDLARAYIDMGDLDSAGSTLKEVVTSGNASQVEAARVLQKQLV